MYFSNFTLLFWLKFYPWELSFGSWIQDTALALFFYFFALTSSDRKHHTCLDNYITPLGSDSFIKNCQTAFRGVFELFDWWGSEMAILLMGIWNVLAGKIVKDSEYFRDERFIWPEGYTAVRQFTSITGGSSLFCLSQCCCNFSYFKFLW